MAAIDTIGLWSGDALAHAFPFAMIPAVGDSLTIRSFPPGQKAGINALIYNSDGVNRIRVISPNLHDNVTGITFEPAEQPAQYLVPRDVTVDVTSGDTLAVYGGTTAAAGMVAGLSVYYSQFTNLAARLHSWGDIAGNIRFVKPVEVDLAAIANGVWTDTLLTTTENQLHAGQDYAVLGWNPNAAVSLVGVKGSFTGNLRIAGPGATSTLDETEYFIRMAELNAMPYIPVFNADDRFGVYVSAFHKAAIAGAAERVYLIIAQLTARLGS